MIEPTATPPTRPLEPELPPPELAAWERRRRAHEAAGHERFRGFLADAGDEALPALRHLLGCPLCERLARLVLFGFLPGAADHPAPRRRGRRHKTATDRQARRGEHG